MDIWELATLTLFKCLLENNLLSVPDNIQLDVSFSFVLM